jgi:hypothetical protein
MTTPERQGERPVRSTSQRGNAAPGELEHRGLPTLLVEVKVRLRDAARAVHRARVVATRGPSALAEDRR